MATMKVCITGAAGQIGYSLIPMIAHGRMFGPGVKLSLSLLDITPAMTALNGVKMEIEDLASPLVTEVIATDDTSVAFKDIDVCVMLGAFPRKQGMERKDLLEKNAGIFKAQGAALAAHAKSDVKVVVVGNPANTNALTTVLSSGGKLNPQNVTALTRLDHNRARAQIAARVGVAVEDVHGVCIWGNHSSTQFPDISNAHVVKDGKKIPVAEAVDDNAWLESTFITTVQKRGAAIIEARKLSSAMSAANAVVEHIHDWFLGSAEVVSMAVPSGACGIPEGLVFSYPVRCLGEWKYEIVSPAEISEFSKKLLAATTEELQAEKATCAAFLA